MPTDDDQRRSAPRDPVIAEPAALAVAAPATVMRIHRVIQAEPGRPVACSPPGRAFGGPAATRL